MARFYTNENFRRKAVEALRQLGHDVLTSFDAGNANQRVPDEDVLKFATANNRIVVTFNRKDFIRLHRLNPNHAGIIVCTEDPNHLNLAKRIEEVILSQTLMNNQLIRVNRPNSPSV